MSCEMTVGSFVTVKWSRSYRSETETELSSCLLALWRESRSAISSLVNLFIETKYTIRMQTKWVGVIWFIIRDNLIINLIWNYWLKGCLRNVALASLRFFVFPCQNIGMWISFWKRISVLKLVHRKLLFVGKALILAQSFVDFFHGKLPVK